MATQGKFSRNARSADFSTPKSVTSIRLEVIPCFFWQSNVDMSPSGQAIQHTMIGTTRAKAAGEFYVPTHRQRLNDFIEAKIVPKAFSCK